MAIKYKWLAAQLKNLLLKNAQEGIIKLPSENELCEIYHVSRQTVRDALAILEQDRYIERRKGSGTYFTGLLPQVKNHVAILISSANEYIYPALLEDIQTSLSASGFSACVYETANQFGTERQILRSLLENPPRGIMVEGCQSALPNPNLDLYNQLQKKGIPLLFLYNYYPQLTNCLYIKDDNYSGSVRLVQYLHSQNRKKIGGIFKSDDMQGIERFQGYSEALRDIDLPVADHRICWYNSKELKKLEQNRDTSFLREMVQSSFTDCDAIICYNSEIAYWLIKELSQAGYHLPQDIAIATFDNTYLTNRSFLPITALGHKPHEMGQMAASLLIQKIKGLAVHCQQVPWSLTEKESSMSLD